MFNDEGEILEVARRPKTKVFLEIPFDVKPYSMLRKVVND